MNQKEYNGWTNYETWNVALWIGNEENSSCYWNEQAEECWNRTKDEDDATRELADMLKDSFEQEAHEVLGERSCSVFGDLLGAALSEVNWHEIAKGMVDEVEKPEPEEVESEEA